MELPVRFASIPKCASRTLKSYGLLGEVDGKEHNSIKDYPRWSEYKWIAVVRPEADWYASWWNEAKRSHDIFEHWFGLRFNSLADDLNALRNPIIPKGILLPRMSGVHSWVPPDFCESFPKSGLSFMEYCYSVIVADVHCQKLPISELDNWLSIHGFEPVHLNTRES